MNQKIVFTSVSQTKAGNIDHASRKTTMEASALRPDKMAKGANMIRRGKVRHIPHREVYVLIVSSGYAFSLWSLIIPMQTKKPYGRVTSDAKETSTA